MEAAEKISVGVIKEKTKRKKYDSSRSCKFSIYSRKRSSNR